MKRRSSTQTVHMGLEAIEDGVVRLAGHQYRGVLEVGSVNFGLAGEVEREGIVDSYAAFLNSLTFPVQVLVRVLPVDLETYLAEMERQAQTLAEPLDELARDHAIFLRRLARHRTLLERRFYVVVPAEAEGLHASRSRFLPQRVAGPTPDAARRQLTHRCEEVARQLGRCGLSARRLGDVELAQLYHAYWCPDLARAQRVRRRLTEYVNLVVSQSSAERRP
ncbi:MAG: hypothetical protein U0822_11290 [Anaerolineae bacterium]